MPTRIEWCDETVNPLGHGCYGPGGTAENPNVCPYCYAYKLAQRDMRGCDLCKQFIPHTHFDQLEKLSKWKKPRRIFMQSMGDLFHDSVPYSWIAEVFRACEAAPWHRYMFLTKNPKRYYHLAGNGMLPASDNMWYGTTTPTPDTEFFWSEDHHCFVSIEPIQEYFSEQGIPNNVDWVIIGSETGNRKGKILPKRYWIESLEFMCREAMTPVFMKNSLAEVWGGPLIQEWPEGLRI